MPGTERRKRKRCDSEEEEKWRGKVFEGYVIDKRIGAGSFGDCFLGHNEAGHEICLKIENAEMSRPKLQTEHQMMKTIEDFHSDRTARGVAPDLRIPRALHITSEPPHNVLAQELLGPSLEDLFQKCGRSFDSRTVLMLAKFVIDAIQQVHEAGIIHKDIKPHNFLVGRGKRAHMIYVIDFGLSKRYLTDGNHLAFRLGRNMSGTSRYVGLNVHRGYEASRRDDMESIGYMLVYLLRGRLPWQGVGAQLPKARRNDLIHTSKESTPLATLCQGQCPCFLQFLQYTKSLEFAQDIDYDYCRSLFQRDLVKHFGEPDYSKYKWVEEGVYTDGS